MRRFEQKYVFAGRRFVTAMRVSSRAGVEQRAADLGKERGLAPIRRPDKEDGGWAASSTGLFTSRPGHWRVSKRQMRGARGKVERGSGLNCHELSHLSRPAYRHAHRLRPGTMPLMAPSWSFHSLP